MAVTTKTEEGIGRRAGALRQVLELDRSADARSRSADARPLGRSRRARRRRVRRVRRRGNWEHPGRSRAVPGAQRSPGAGGLERPSADSRELVPSLPGRQCSSLTNLTCQVATTRPVASPRTAWCCTAAATTRTRLSAFSTSPRSSMRRWPRRAASAQAVEGRGGLARRAIARLAAGLTRSASPPATVALQDLGGGETTPTPRKFHAACSLYPWRPLLVIFGGWQVDRHFDDMWVLAHGGDLASYGSPDGYGSDDDDEVEIVLQVGGRRERVLIERSTLEALLGEWAIHRTAERDIRHAAAAGGDDAAGRRSGNGQLLGGRRRRRRGPPRRTTTRASIPRRSATPSRTRSELTRQPYAAKHLLLRRREVLHEPPRPEVDLDDLVQRRLLDEVRLVRLHGRLDDPRNVEVLEGALAEHLVRHLVRRVEAPVIVPPTRPAAYASPMQGYLSLSRPLNVMLPNSTRSKRGSHWSWGMRTRCGQLTLYSKGSRMSGQPSCAITELSCVSIALWMIDCGCTTTSMSS